MTPDQFRALGYRLIDWIADYRRNIDQLPVQSQVPPGWVRRELNRPPPEHPEDPEALFADLERVIVPGLSHFQHPSNFAFYPANASLASVLGELASSGLGVVGLNWEAAPALTELEEVVCNWLRELFGLAPVWHGALHDTASTACLVAALCARERANRYASARGGMCEGPPLTMYASTQAHSSITKAVLLAGIGREHLRLLPVDDAYRMDTGALAAAMDRDRRAGRVPAAVFTNVGATSTAAIDPVADIADCAAQHGAWVHVDAAMAGSAMLLEECRPLWHGVEKTDSVSINAHKWMGTVIDCALLYVREPDNVMRVMSTDPSYLRTHRADDVTQLRNWGIPLGRRFRALKLWFHLRLDGVAAIRERLRRDIANARWLADCVRAEPEWTLTAPQQFQTLCVRHEPRLPALRQLTSEQLDAHTLAWVKAVNRSGAAYLTPIILDGQWTGRISIGSEPTERSDVEALWQSMRTAATEAAGALA